MEGVASLVGAVACPEGVRSLLSGPQGVSGAEEFPPFGNAVRLGQHKNHDIITGDGMDTLFNPLTSVSHWSGFKVELTFHGIQFFGSSLYTRHILEIYAYKFDCRMYLVQFRPCISQCI